MVDPYLRFIGPLDRAVTLKSLSLIRAVGADDSPHSVRSLPTTWTSVRPPPAAVCNAQVKDARFLPIVVR